MCKLWEAIEEIFSKKTYDMPSTDNITEVNLKPMPSNRDKLYQIAKSLMGQHLTLDTNVPPDVGCAECLSYILKEAGVPGIPASGIPGTAQLIQFLSKSPSFSVVSSPLPGDIIISPSTPGAVVQHGHVGICANYGILSNDSNTGTLQEQWNLDKWNAYYHQYGGLTVTFFRYL